MQEFGTCSGCRHLLVVPAEFLSSPIVCPKCGKVSHNAKNRAANLLTTSVSRLFWGSILFLIGMGIASGILDDDRSDRPNQSYQQSAKVVPYRAPSQD